jgi:hypothetical protein
LVGARIALACPHTRRTGDFPAHGQCARKRRTEIDAHSDALFGRIELERELRAVLDLAPEKDAEAGSLDERIGVTLGRAAQRQERERQERERQERERQERRASQRSAPERH